MTVIDYDRKFFFVKTIKTGSTSFEQWLLSDELSEHTLEAAPEVHSSHLYYSGRSLSRGRQSLLRSHATLNEIQSFIGERAMDFVGVTIVRHPLDKVVSLFWFELREINFLRDWLTKAPFPVVRASFAVWANFRKLKHISDYRRLDVGKGGGIQLIIRYEHLQHDLRKMVSEDVFGHLDPDHFPSLKTGFRRRKEPWKLYYTKKLLTRMRQIFEKDLAYFGYE